MFVPELTAISSVTGNPGGSEDSRVNINTVDGAFLFGNPGDDVVSAGQNGHGRVALVVAGVLGDEELFGGTVVVGLLDFAGRSQPSGINPPHVPLPFSP